METRSIRAAVACAAALSATVVAAPAEQVTRASEDQIVELVIATGSRIARPTGAESPTPMTVLGSEQIELSGNINLGDLLNDLPSLRSTFGLQNSSRFIGTTGLNLLDLRGLGDDRTLVLVDGRRHVGSVNGSSSVDINTIPAALVDRVEIITGGASAIYGADAVTGVVNFVMKHDFEGLQVDGYSLQPSEQGGETYQAEVAWGTNFMDGRGNVALFLGRSELNEIRGVDREWITDEIGAVSNPADTGPDDGIPDLIYRKNARNNIISTAGMIWGEHPAENVFGLPVAAILGLAVPGGPYTFDASGNLVAFDPGQLFTAPTGLDDTTSIGGDGLGFANSTQMIPDLERDNFFGSARFEVNRHLNVSGEAKYVNVESTSYGQPTFDFFGDLIVTTDNPFMPVDLVNVLDSVGLPFVSINRFHEDLGFRGEEIERETQRYVLAIDGDMTDTWQYQASWVFGRYEGHADETNNRNNVKFANAVDAIADPVTGQPVCRDPAARADGCLPLNLFGEGRSSPEAIAYIMEPGSEFDEELTQEIFSVHATGELVPLPAGSMRMAIGMEWREEESKVKYADIIKSGDTFFNALADGDGDYDVLEGFVEFSIPIVADRWMFEDLTFDAAARFSEYSTIGGTNSWKMGIDWMPIEDVRFRSTVSQAVRAPNIGELFDPLGQNFFDVQDPCSESELTTAPDPALRLANCTALGRPAGFESFEDSAFLPGFSGGNDDLTEEEAKTWTYGAVITPRWVPNLTVILDYWDIEIENAISAVAAQDILDKCVDGPSTDNIFCPLVTRRAGGAVGQFEITEIIQTVLNISRLEASGIDLELGYLWDLGDTFGGEWGSLNFRLIGTHVYKYEDFDFEDDPQTADDERGEIGNPIDNALANVTYERGPLTVNWRVEYLDEMRLIENEAAREREDPYTTDEVIYHDVQVRYVLEDLLTGDLTVYGGVSNLTDEAPAEYLTGIGEGSGIYDIIGRAYYLGFSFRMGESG